MSMHINSEPMASEDLPDAQAENIKLGPAPSSTSHLAPCSLAHSGAGLQPFQRDTGRILRSHTACKSQVPVTGATGADQGTVDMSLALAYLDKVKAHFVNDPGVYRQFLDTMLAFKHGQLDTPGVIQRASTLFSEHPTLIEKFRAFHPPGY